MYPSFSRRSTAVIVVIVVVVVAVALEAVELSVLLYNASMSTFFRGQNQKQQGGQGQRLNNNGRIFLTSNDMFSKNTVGDRRFILDNHLPFHSSSVGLSVSSSENRSRYHSNNNNTKDGSTTNKNASRGNDHTLRQFNNISNIMVIKNPPKEQSRRRQRKHQRSGSRPRAVFNVDGIRAVAPPEAQAKIVAVAVAVVDADITTTTASAFPKNDSRTSPKNSNLTSLPTVLTKQDPTMNFVLNKSSNTTTMAMMATTMEITNDVPREENNLHGALQSLVSHKTDSTLSVSSTRYKHWTKEEDGSLRNAIVLEGNNKIDWEEISGKYFNTTRSGQQCRLRWTSVS